MCGRKPLAGFSNIVGGSEVIPHSIPWQVGLDEVGVKRPIDCGGTLISDRHVLTAAHCKPSHGMVHVIVGEHNISSPEDGIRHEICRFVNHPNYNNPEYDFAILHLKTPV